MDFSLTNEQALLQDSVTRFVVDRYGFESRQKRLEQGYSLNAEYWKLFAELGWLALPFSEEDGGLDGSAVESMLLMEQFGKGLVVEPYLATVVLAGGLLARTGNEAQKTQYLAPLMEGNCQGGAAFAEPQSRYDLADVSVSAARGEDGWTLSGAKALVLNAPDADFFVVSARIEGQRRDPRGIGLFLLPARTSGVVIREYTTVDGFGAGEVQLENVRLPLSALLSEDALPHLERVIDEAVLTIGSEAVGCMQVIHEDTLEYSRNRVQFGKPIGQFQVLQHRMVDMFMALEQTRSLMMMTAIYLARGDDALSRKAVSAFKVQVNKAGRFISQAAVQIHGGMGMTEELRLGHHVKRLTVIGNLFGDVDFHLRRLGSL